MSRPFRLDELGALIRACAGITLAIPQVAPPPVPVGQTSVCPESVSLSRIRETGQTEVCPTGKYLLTSATGSFGAGRVRSETREEGRVVRRRNPSDSST